jgi:flagellar biosynthetic protein FliQ
MGYSEDFCATFTCFNDCRIIISLFQTLTSIQEQTLTFVPKLLAIMIALMIMGNWLLNEIVSFMQMLWGSFGQYI